MSAVPPATPLDLVLWTGAVYGASWGVSRSLLLKRPREIVAGVPLLGALVRCIVCTSAWVSAGGALLLPWATLLSSGLRVHALVDAAILVFWSVFSTWVIAHALGDAD